MDSSPRPARLFVTRVLPWLLAAAVLVFYLATVSTWVTPASLFTTVQAAGWDWLLPSGRPLLYLAGLALKAVAGPQFPLAANIFTAVLAAGVAWALARCVALLPHDRTQTQRVREPSEIGLLTISLAWVPPVLAVLTFSLALTVWQHATSFTGEMIDLAVFAYCVLCLAEYRLDQSEGRLARMAFFYGIGMANNWGLVAYAPAFAVAICWIKGWEVFRPGFLLRFFLLGLLGLGLLLLLPAVMNATHRQDAGFWTTLQTELIGIKGAILGTPRGKVALFAVIMVLPLAVIGVRWDGFPDVTLETVATQFFLHLIQVAWMVGCVLVMLDSKFSPRQIVVNPPLIPFYFCAALSIGYFAGFYLLVASRNPEELPRGEIPFLVPLAKLVALAAVAGCVAVPFFFLKRNLAIARAENGSALRDLSDSIYGALPQQPSLLLVDDPINYYLSLARVKSQAGGPDHLVLNTTLAANSSYRTFLANEHAQAWPDLAKLSTITQNVAGAWISETANLAKPGRAFFVNPTFGFFSERLDMIPLGSAFAVKIAPSLVPAPLTEGEGDALVAFWKKTEPILGALKHSTEIGATNVTFVALSWSRLQNASGVELQRAGRLAEARTLFENSLRLFPANAAAQVNLRVNEALAKKTPIPSDIDRPLESQPGVLDRFGPVDEPNFLYYYGRSLLRPQESLVRRAAVAFDRASQIDPGNRFYRLGYAEACLTLGLTSDATNTLENLRRAHPMLEWTGPEQGEWFRVRASADAQLNDVAGAEASLLAARKADPHNDQVHDALSYIYLLAGRPEKAMEVLADWEKALPNSPNAPARRALILMYQHNYTNALPALEKVLKISADDDLARLNRAICNLQLHRLAESKSDYQMLLRKRETYQVRYGLATIAKFQTNRKDEIENLDRYLEIAPHQTAEYTNAVTRMAELQKGR